MEEVFLCYKTDIWHSHTSKDLFAIGTSRAAAVGLCQQKAVDEGEKIDLWNVSFLRDKSQTQGYEGTGEFVIEHFYTNQL